MHQQFSDFPKVVSWPVLKQNPESELYPHAFRNSKQRKLNYIRHSDNIKKQQLHFEVKTLVFLESTITKGGTQIWNGDLLICSQMLYHWAIPPCIKGFKAKENKLYTSFWQFERTTAPKNPTNPKGAPRFEPVNLLICLDLKSRHWFFQNAPYPKVTNEFDPGTSWSAVIFFNHRKEIRSISLIKSNNNCFDLKSRPWFFQNPP